MGDFHPIPSHCFWCPTFTKHLNVSGFLVVSRQVSPEATSFNQTVRVVFGGVVFSTCSLGVQRPLNKWPFRKGHYFSRDL